LVKNSFIIILPKNHPIVQMSLYQRRQVLLYHNFSVLLTLLF
jgi:hypothetical protein